MTPTDETATESLRVGARRNLFDVAVVCIGLLGAVFYFFINVTLPDWARGLLCCDAATYLRLSDGGLSNVFSHSSLRIFGYPFYLALFREIFRGHGDFLLPALILQLCLHVGSAVVLFYAVRIAGIRVPYVALALLLAHPALVGMSAISLTDSLSTSILSSTFALIILLLYRRERAMLKSFLIGVLFGFLLCLRPSTSTLMFPALLIIGLCAFAQTYKQGGQWRQALAKSSLTCIVILCGYLPMYGHLVRNCYVAHHEWCVIPSSEVRGNVPRSFLLAIQCSRLWTVVTPQGNAELGRTEERILNDCDIRFEGSGSSDLLACYGRNLSKLPRHFLSRFLGLFDNRHLNSYAALTTTPAEYWMIRIFSIIGMVGFVAAVGILGASLWYGGVAQQGHLVLALTFLAIQLNFHTETRYIYPIIPLLFLLGVSLLTTNPLPRRWLHITVLATALLVTVIFTATVVRWDQMTG